MDYKVFPLFPNAVYASTLGRKLSSLEIEFIKNSIVNKQGLGNKSSPDTFILENTELSELKKDILDHVHRYARDLISVDNEFYLTNSWKNVTDQDEVHQLHYHSNSIISGVFYVDVEDSQNTISFNRMTSPYLLNFKPKSFNVFNSIEWDVPVENNMILLFPSSCYHYVKKNNSENKRISIAFNTFVRGKIGTEFSGADLILN